MLALGRKPQFLSIWASAMGYLNILMTLLVFSKEIKRESWKLQCFLWPNLGSHTPSLLPYSLLSEQFWLSVGEDSTKAWTPRKRQGSLKGMLGIGYHNQLSPALSKNTISLYSHQYAILSDLIIFNNLINKKCFCFIFMWLLVRLSIILHILGHNSSPSVYCLITSFFFYWIV